MELQLLEVVISFLVGGVIMVLHEFPKTFLYFVSTTIEGRKKYWYRLFYLHNYIDPIGMILSVVSYAGFSKPYMFRIQSQKKNLLLGITGFVTLGTTFICSIWVLRYTCHLSALEITGIGIHEIVKQLFWIYMAVLSASMFFVNLFPVSVFDMGLLIAGSSPRYYFGIIKNDVLIKIVLFFAIAVGVIRYFSFGVVRVLLAMS